MRTFTIEADWLRAAPLARLLAALSSFAQARVVGGAVRNTLLAEPLGDVDVATTALPETVAARLRRQGFSVHETGLSHGTVTVVSSGQPFEVTTLRRDVATDGRHATVAFTDDFAVDARRRDFTMNALYVAPDGVGVDYVGGYEDCLARRVRFIGDAEERIHEDYLRILRFFRFHAAYGAGALDAAGLAAARRHRDGLERLSVERIHQEMTKLLRARGAPNVLDVLAREALLRAFLDPLDAAAFRALRTAGAALDRAPSAALGYAALVSFRRDRFATLAERLKFAHKDRDRGLAALEAAASLPVRSTREARALLYRHGADAFADGLTIALARGADPTPVAPLVDEARRWRALTFPVSGHDLLRQGGTPGPSLGARLRRLEALWIDSDFSLDREALLALDRAEARDG